MTHLNGGTFSRNDSLLCTSLLPGKLPLTALKMRKTGLTSCEHVACKCIKNLIYLLLLKEIGTVFHYFKWHIPQKLYLREIYCNLKKYFLVKHGPGTEKE